jgi:DMSO/TMAO reductase YedYZ molybdopterin-dependent catalytic subunit
MPDPSPVPPPRPPLPPADPADRPAADIRRSTRRAFGVFAAGGAVAGGAWWWLRTRTADGGIPWPLRQVHRLNERVGRGLFAPTHLAPEFPARAAEVPRTNGHYGEPESVPAGGWVVAIEMPGRPAETVTPAALLAGLPRTESTTELKCIEGWSTVVRWGGVRFADVAAARGWPVAEFPYVSLATPDGGYYVGLDVPSALHPQTLLCDEMNGEPLPPEHGGPLRLTIPVKYGIKNIKWIGRVRFGADRPADFWAERGYDWYAGL